MTQYQFQELHVATAVDVPLDEQTTWSYCHAVSIFSLLCAGYC